MVSRNKSGTLTATEKRVAKSLLANGMRNQDIQALLNLGRKTTVNSARITEVKVNDKQKSASEKELALFHLSRRYFDPKTGLNDIDHERLIRARESMMMAVHIFNSPHLKFRTEMFAVLAQIAWTYLLHEYHEVTLRESIEKADGQTVSMSTLLTRKSSPLSKNARRNLEAIKEIRDNVEHRTCGPSDDSWLGLFQACCVNFNHYCCSLFGEKLSLQSNLGFALQFSKISLDQIDQTQSLAIPAPIQALDARLNGNVNAEDPLAAEYKFQIVYTLDSATKSGANLRFVSPNSVAGQQIHNILVKHRPSDDDWPFKPGIVVKHVQDSIRSFTAHDHQLAWKRHRARPKSNAKDKAQTNREYCIYHKAHGDYTYSQAWVDFLKNTYSDKDALSELRCKK